MFQNRTSEMTPYRTQPEVRHRKSFRITAIAVVVVGLLWTVAQEAHGAVFAGCPVHSAILAHVGWQLLMGGTLLAAISILCGYLFFSRKKTEMSSIFRAAPLGAGLLSNRVFIHVNDRMCQISGYSAEELVGQSSRMLYITQADYDFVGREKYRQIEEQGVGTVETRWRCKDGRVIDVLLGSSPIDARDLSRGVVFTAMDITEQKKTEQALRFTQFAMDHAGEAAFWMGQDGKLVYVNEAACQSLGYTREELLQMTTPDLDPNFPKEKWDEHWAQARQTGFSRIETLHRAKDGRLIPVEISINFVSYEGAEYHCSFSRDISERKAAEEARKKLIAALQSKNEELQSILFIASHDLRSPLVNIRGFSGELEKSLTQLRTLLAHETFSESAKNQLAVLLDTDIPESMHFINAGNSKIDTLLTGLLQLSRIGSGQLCPVTLDMNHLFKGIVNNLRFRMRHTNIDIVVDKPLPACRGDAVLINQVFTNLVENAIEYRHPNHPARIHVSAEVKEQTVIYCVADNGIGIAPEYLDKVFEIFYRLNGDGDPAGEGLGLTIVRRILDRQDGHIWIESTPDIGTSVYVRLPRA